MPTDAPESISRGSLIAGTQPPSRSSATRPRSAQDAENCREEGRSDNCPEQREGIFSYGNGKRLREAEPARQPKPKKCANETDDDGDQAAAEGISGEGLAEASGNGRDEQKDQQLKEGHGWLMSRFGEKKEPVKVGKWTRNNQSGQVYSVILKTMDSGEPLLNWRNQCI